MWNTSQLKGYHFFCFIYHNWLNNRYSRYSIKKRNIDSLSLTPIIAISVVIAIFAPIIIGELKRQISSNGGINYILCIVSIGVGISMTKFAWQIYETILCKDQISDMARIKKFSQKYHNVQVRNYSPYSVPNEVVEKIRQLINNSKIEFNIIDASDFRAYAEVDKKDNCHRIVLSRSCFENLSWEQIAAVIGHELMHIKLLNGSNWDRLRNIAGGVVLFILMILSLFLLTIFEKYFGIIGVLLEIVFAFITIAVFLYWLLYSSINSNRYWGQIYELMCDRKACELNGVTAEGMKSLLEYLYNNFKEFNKYKWYFKYYYKYFVVLEHPCLKYSVSANLKRPKADGIA